MGVEENGEETKKSDKDRVSVSVGSGCVFAAGEEQCSQRGTTGRAAQESVSGYWQNTIAKCHEDIFGVGFFPPRSLPRQKCSQSPKRAA